MIHFKIVPIYLLAALLFIEAIPAKAQFSFTPLGDWSPTGVSGDGSIVVGNRTSPTRWGIRWTEATGAVLFPFEPQPGIELVTLAISDDGSAAVGTWSLNPGHEFRAIRWTATGGNKQLAFTMLDRSSIARDVSSDGSVVVGSVTPFSGGFGPFYRWTTNSGITDLDETNAYIVSGDGRVVAGGPYRWTADEGVMHIPKLIGADAGVSANDISTDGSIIAGIALSHVEGEIYTVPHAIRWSPDRGTISLGDLPGGEFLSAALGVSGNGSVIVGYGTAETNVRSAMIWTEQTGMLALRDFLSSNGVSNLDGWQLRSANRISADGTTIVGVGINPSGEAEAWIATIPEPPTLVVAAIAVLGVLVAALNRVLCAGPHPE